MRRLSATALLAMLSLALILPLLFQPAEERLPACCRRDGKHDCAMTAQGHGSEAAVSAIRAKCPAYPAGQASVASGQLAGVAQASELWAPDISPSAAVEQAEAQYRVSFSRAWHKRGPPSLLS